MAVHYGVTPSQLLREPMADFHLDMMFGIAAMRRQNDMLKLRRADDTFKAIVGAVYTALKAAR